MDNALNNATTRKIVYELIRLGVGALILIGGLVIMIIGITSNREAELWPHYLIAGSVVLFVGLMTTCLEIFKDLRQQKIDLQKVKKDTEQVKLNTEMAKNYDVYKAMTNRKIAESRKEHK